MGSHKVALQMPSAKTSTILIDHEGQAAFSWHTRYLAQVPRWHLYLVLISTKYFVKLVLVLVLEVLLVYTTCTYT